MAHTKSKIVPYSVIFLTLKSATVQDHSATWIIFIETIPCKEWANINGIFQGIFSTSISRGWGIFLVRSSYSIQELMLFRWTHSGSLVCQMIPGKRFWKATPCSPLPLPISNTEPFLIILDSTSPMKSLFLWVAEKKSLLSKIKKIGRFSKNNNSKILNYLTCLNLGVLKNIILRLKNNIEIVRAGKI